jgi:hypothetical protein
MQLVSPFPGSLAGAREKLVAAQGFAANVVNDPYNKAVENLTSGLQAAKAAAAELFLAEPRSPFQDLVAARRQVLEGANLLEQAFYAHGSAQGVDPLPRVKALAGQAFDAFENAFEIIDND